jgi:hypothetical protein
MATKVELLVYSNGMYGIRRTSKFLIFTNSISYYDLVDKKWRDQNNAFLRDCFTTDRDIAEAMCVVSGYAEGTLFYRNRLISLRELAEMNTLAENDEGMKDVLNQAKAYYTLKKK